MQIDAICLLAGDQGAENCGEEGHVDVGTLRHADAAQLVVLAADAERPKSAGRREPQSLVNARREVRQLRRPHTISPLPCQAAFAQATGGAT